MIRIQDESQSLIPMVLIFWVCEKNAKIECEIEFVRCFKKRMKRAERTSFTAAASLGTHGSMMGMFMRVVIHPQQNRIERFDNLLAPKKYLLNTKKKKKKKPLSASLACKTDGNALFAGWLSPQVRGHE